MASPHELLAVPTQFSQNRQLRAKVYLEKLLCSSTQHSALQALYDDGTRVLRNVYAEHSPIEQQRGQELLRYYQLDLESRERLESRWKVAWVDKTHRQDGSTATRVLLQCACGYDTSARQAKKRKHAPSASSPEEPWERHAPYNYTGCLVHVDLTTVDDTRVTRVIGFFDHNDTCKEERMKRYPAIPLHPHVYDIAVSQLRQGANITQVQDQNSTLFQNRLYRDQATTHPELANYRWQILPRDFSSIYRRHFRESYGIDVNIPAERNVDNWLDKDSKHYNPRIAQSVFHYQARAKKGERVKVCICTEEMRQAAWKYCHHSQIILDGTFGVASSRLLLWIAMGVDESGSGVPVAMFLFSAPTGTTFTPGGYDIEVLQSLLQEWKNWMKLRDPASREFEPYAAITDNDARERAAILGVWTSILLIICRFHVRQCWRNKTNTLFSTLDCHFTVYVLKQIKTLEKELLATTVYTDACGLIESARTQFASLVGSCPQASKPVEKAKKYLDYLSHSYMGEDLWKSWSSHNRERAALKIGVPVTDILPTTNHLESFNGVLKRKYLVQWQHAGHRLRFDILVFHLIVHILPRVYARRRMITGHLSWRNKRFLAATGGVVLPTKVKSSGIAVSTPSATSTFVPRAWYPNEPIKEAAASFILHQNKLHTLQSHRPTELWAYCESSPYTFHPQPATPSKCYWLSVHPSGAATCTCLDWTSRGGACKHLRAFRLLIQHWKSLGTLAHSFHFPTTEDEAIEVENRNRHWYGDHYPLHVTQFPSPSTSSSQPTGTSPTAVSSDPPPHFHVERTEDALAAALPPLTEDFLPSVDAEAALGQLAKDPECDPQNETLEEEHVPHSDSEEVYAQQRRGIDIQMEAIIHHEISKIGRPLGEIADLLSDRNLTLSHSPEICSFRETLVAVIAGLDSRMRISAPHEDEHSVYPVADQGNQPSTPPPIAREDAGVQRVVLPPSPEGRQRRKDSRKIF